MLSRLNCLKVLRFFEDIFDDSNPEEQCYIADIMIENLKKKTVLDQIM